MSEIAEPIEMPYVAYAMKSGLIAGLIYSLIYVALYFGEQSGELWAAAGTYLLLLVMAYFFQKRFRDTYQGGFISFGRAFGIGFIIQLVIGLVSSVPLFVLFYKFPGPFERVLNKQTESMIEKGVSDAQIEAMSSSVSTMITPSWMVASTVVMSVFFGLVLSLITSAIVKRTHPNEIS